MKDVQPTLEFIIDTLEVIRENTPTDKEVFLRDLNARDATIMRLQDIGEQLTHIRDIHPDYYEKYHTDEWNKLIGLRNIISHGYHEIEFDIIWDIITDKLTDFTTNIQQLAKSD